MMGRQSRQRPVSCHFCRVRKLRCSRQFPCSNCTSRGVECREPADPPPSTTCTLRTAAVTKRTSPSPSSPSANSDVLARLERLESLLAIRNKEVEVQSTGRQPPEPSPVVTLRSQLPLPPKLQGLTADALFLERSCLGPKLSDSVLSDDIVFRTCPIRLITQSSSYVFQNSNVPSASLSIQPTKCIWLPTRDEAKILVDKYIADLTYLHHIVHGPSLREVVDDVYDSLDQYSHIHVGLVSLLLALFADVTYSWTNEDQARQLFTSAAEANAQPIFWTKAALDVFDYCQRNAHLSIECIQGHMVLSYVICNLEGISMRARCLLAKATTLSYEMGLHRIDYPHNPPSEQLTGLKAEVGRRVWWYLVGTNWMLARFSGPPEGTYNINPRHMVVNRPINANDEDLKDGEPMIDLPLDQPTCMSYFLQRARLAQVSLGFTDRMPLASDPEAVSYDTILEVDRALEQFLREAPPFFTIAADEVLKLPLTDPLRSPSITVQRHILNLFVHGQRLKIHLPYLARATVEPEYAYSREVCLKAARFILQIEHRLEKENHAFSITRLKLTVVLHSLFLASIVLLLDVCTTSNSSDRAAKQQEMAEAWRIMEQAQGQSVPAARLMELLKQVMKKHKVSFPAVQPQDQSVTRVDAPLMTPTSGISGEMSGDTAPFEPAYYGDDLENLGQRMELDDINWDSLFWGLDAPFI